VSAELCEQVKRNRKNQSSRSPLVQQWCSIRVAPATVNAAWLWGRRSAIVARVRDRNPIEVAHFLGRRFLAITSVWPTIRPEFGSILTWRFLDRKPLAGYWIHWVERLKAKSRR